MKKGIFTREQAINIVGEDHVAKLDFGRCDFTNRVGFNGSPDDDYEVEFAASMSCKDKEGRQVTLIVYYYQYAEDVDSVENLDELPWAIAGYDIC